MARVLENLSKGQLIEFGRVFRDAAEAIVPYWEGPLVDGIQFSEDDTEDLCHWIVGQGLETWQRAISERDLQFLAREAWQSRRTSTGRSTGWDDDLDPDSFLGSRSILGMASAVFEARFGESLFDALGD
ncbi:MAG: hypothetical protein JST54_29220 [Deltaproteobacteria bacterium]|nr:hypothetical protein [Deltaproteobacteria bacterium]